MKFLSVVFILSLCTSVSAQDGEMFAKRKEHALVNIDKRIGFLQEMKSCISSATDKDGIQKCRQDHKEKMKSIKDENADWKEGRKAERAAKKKK